MNNFRISLLVATYVMIALLVIGTALTPIDMEVVTGLLMHAALYAGLITFLYKVKPYLPNKVQELENELEQLKKEKSD